MADKVKVICKDETIEGILVPSEDSKFVVVKLDSGYNIGIKKNKVKEIKKLGTVKVSATKPKPVKSKGPKITILHTGGTIASKVDYETGAVTSKFDPKEILAMFPELADIAQVDSRLLRNIMSENMRFEHYNLLAKEVEKEVKKGAKGVIITQGTDTLHYTAAALSFALENVPIPVLVVGSQRSSDRPSTDGYMNLICAATFIANSNFSGVGVCMHENISDDTCLIINGVDARKMHSSRRDAFRPVNAIAVARVDYEKKKIQMLRKTKAPAEKFKLKLFDPKKKVGLVKLHTNMYAAELEPYKKFDALVLELFALGQGPVLKQDDFMHENEKIGKILKSLSLSIPIGASSQCLYGRVDMTVYSEGRHMMSLGVIGNGTDMTPETAFIKMAWLISNYKPDEVRQLYSENLRGEISEQTEKDAFLN